MTVRCCAEIFIYACKSYAVLMCYVQTRRHGRNSGVFIVMFDFTDCSGVFIIDFEQVTAGWVTEELLI